MSQRQRQWKKSGSKGGTEKGAEKVQPRTCDETSPVIKSFLAFQKELDTKYDKRECLVKLSRDITILSKRVIFQLHRFSEGDNFDEAMSEAEAKLKEICGFFEKIARELEGEDPYKFARAYSGGVQEFVEAVTFLHYIRDNKLINYDEVCVTYLTFDKEDDSSLKLVVLLTPMDYILGIADLTGELMRMCINYIGAGHSEESNDVCLFLRKIHDECLVFSGRNFRELNQKIKVLRQSLRKVENACYNVHLRGKEVPKHKLIDLVNFKGNSALEEDANI